MHRLVIARCRDQLHACPACDCPVERVDNPTVRTDLAGALPCREVCKMKGMVGGNGVEERGTQRPLEVEDCCFMESREMTVICGWRIRSP
jgi:hypothetical protein